MADIVEKDEKTIKIDGRLVYLANPTDIPPCNFVSRSKELAYCETAWDIDIRQYKLGEGNNRPLHFRLQGPPGVGKNEIVYEIARRLKLPLYTFQGHEEVTPEDLSIHLIPDQPDYKAPHSNVIPLILRASTLATAIYKGGLFFFDEINRVPERALSPLVSVLDDRLYIESAMTGLRIGPKDDETRKRFRFCCALNPGLGEVRSILPEYIEQRTLPVIEVDYFSLEDLLAILKMNLQCPEGFLSAFQEWYNEEESQKISTRQAISLMAFAMRYYYKWYDRDLTESLILKTIAPLIFRS
ncbi:MAG: AAA family ATPase [bacterium]